MDIVAEANELRTRAGNFKKHSDIALYVFLARCLRICESEITEIEKLRNEFKTFPPLPGRNRLFVEKQSDVFQFVIRYVFYGVENHANAHRYAKALREAFAMQIGSEELVGWLRNKGGVNALFTHNRVMPKIVITRCLRLTSPLTLEAREPFTVTLWRRTDGYYDVTEGPHRATEAAPKASCEGKLVGA
jgi:hypothetical protein